MASKLTHFLAFFSYKHEYIYLKELAYEYELNKRVGNFDNRFPCHTEFHSSWLPRMCQKLRNEFYKLGYPY